MPIELEEGQEAWTRRERLTVAHISHRNGAYLVSMYLTEETEDSTPDAMYDCAGSLAAAKRIARAMAEEFGYEPAWRWRETATHGWTLEAKIVREGYRWADE